MLQKKKKTEAQGSSHREVTSHLAAQPSLPQLYVVIHLLPTLVALQQILERWTIVIQKTKKFLLMFADSRVVCQYQNKPGSINNQLKIQGYAKEINGKCFRIIYKATLFG